MQQKLHKCSQLDISAKDSVNIYKENRKKHKVATRGTCEYTQPNVNLSAPVYCELFGDPHLKTFYDVRQTCIVAGAWSLFDNKYITIQVTNDILQNTATSSSATATSKVRKLKFIYLHRIRYPRAEN